MKDHYGWCLSHSRAAHQVKSIVHWQMCEYRLVYFNFKASLKGTEALSSMLPLIGYCKCGFYCLVTITTVCWRDTTDIDVYALEKWWCWYRVLHITLGVILSGSAVVNAFFHQLMSCPAKATVFVLYFFFFLGTIWLQYCSFPSVVSMFCRVSPMQDVCSVLCVSSSVMESCFSSTINGNFSLKQHAVGRLLKNELSIKLIRFLSCHLLHKKLTAENWDRSPTSLALWVSPLLTFNFSAWLTQWQYMIYV